MVNIVNEKEFNEIIKSGTTFVDFFASWCGPCKMISQVIDEVVPSFEDVKFIKINVDNERELSSKLGIMSIPTLMIFKDGKLLDKNVGFMDKNELSEFINRNK